MIFALDMAALLSASASAFFWWRASRSTLRRVHKSEDLDHHDLNRLVVAYNRGQILNARAALATAVSALCVAARFGATLLGY